MTCIATDGKSIAADTLAVDGAGTIMAYRSKIIHLKDGSIAGVAGSAYDFPLIVKWLNEGADPEKWPDVWSKSEFILLMPDGTVRAYNDKGQFLENELLPTALGSGMDIAIGAMEAGATPKQAVEIACRRHNGCGGKIDVLTLKP